jgi:hypothetical protein
MREIRTRVNPSSAVHPLRKAFCKQDGLHRNSGLSEFRIYLRRKSGEPEFGGPSASQERFAKKMDCRVKPGNDGGEIVP